MTNWRGSSLTAGSARGNASNSATFFYTFIDDINGNNITDVGDSFVTAEYWVSGTNATLLTLFHQPIASVNVAQSYGLACANFLNASNNVFFTGEPDGQVFAWTAIGVTNALQRQLFSASYYGKAWHALAGVNTLSGGAGLAGLMVDPANPRTCNVIFWPPQASLPQLPNITETAPSAAVMPSSNPLGGSAVVTVQLWDNEGNASTLLLQYQILGSTNWLNATLTTLDGSPYNASAPVAALPSGSDHLVTWNVMVDLGANVVTNVLLRARAQDFMLVGDWSLPTPFKVNMNQDSNGNGIPDWWEIQHFGNLLQPANGDFDGDGVSNYAEYIADTDPTDPNSFLHLTSIQPVPGGLWIQWQGGTWATQYLQRSSGVGPTNIWMDIFTNAPPTPNPNSFTDYGGTNSIMFYRIRVTR